MKATVIINPIAGARRTGTIGASVDLARSILGAHHYDADIRITTGPTDAYTFSKDAVAGNASMVVAWGGDGTVNGAASGVAGTSIPLAIIPGGSGNGLARDLQIPFDPSQALAIAATGQTRRIDAGDLHGSLFFNIAGLGLDARVAQQFAETGLARRGFSRYASITLRELVANEAADYVVETDGVSSANRALLIAIANARQYGNGLAIAPHARIDDGRLDVVVIGVRPVVQALWELPRLFLGHVERLPGVTVRTGASVRISSSTAILYHVDGEPHHGGPSLAARVHGRALRVKTAN